MKTIIAIVAVMLMYTPLSAHAGRYYQYKGKNGSMHFTDNLADVPPSQRADVRQYKEIKAPTPITHGVQVSPQSKSAVTSTSSSQKMLNDWAGRLNEEAEKLSKKQVALTATFNTLQKERKNITPPPKHAPLKDLQAYQAKVNDINNRIARYEKRRKAFQKQVDAYRAEMKAFGKAVNKQKKNSSGPPP